MRKIVAILTFTLFAPSAFADGAALVEDLRLVARLESEGRHEMALTLASRLVEVNPDSLNANIAYQDLRIARGQQRELLREYSLKANRADATADQVFLHARLLDGRRAIAGFKRALKIDPGHFRALCALGARYVDAGATDKAEELLTRARRLVPSSAVPVNLQGRLAESEGDVKRAEVLYREAADLDTSSALPVLNLGVLLTGQGRHEEARELLKLARRLDPTDPTPLLVRGMSLAAEGDYEGALAEYRKALALKTNTIVSLNLLGAAYMELEQFDLARQALTQALKEDGRNVTTLLNFCYLCLRENNVKKATEWAQKARRIDSKSGQACYFAGLCEEFAGKRKAAERSYRRATELDKDNPEYWRALGTFYSNQTRYRDAVRSYEHAVKFSGRSTTFLFDLAFAHVGAGSSKKALAVFEEIVSKDPGQLKAWMNIGLLCQEKLSDPDRAAEAYGEYLRRGGEDKRVKQWLGQLKRR